jgi:ribosomal protein S12 methylthiotransferase
MWKKYKDAVIRSTFIVGFPGETEKDFEELMEFAKKSGIERLGVFGYSDEENTEAFKLKRKVKAEVIRERQEQLMDISDQNIENYNKKIIGTKGEFLPQGPCPWESHATIGRIKSQAPETDGLTQVNEPFFDDYRMVTIKITGFQNELLYGERI